MRYHEVSLERESASLGPKSGVTYLANKLTKLLVHVLPDFEVLFDRAWVLVIVDLSACPLREPLSLPLGVLWPGPFARPLDWRAMAATAPERACELCALVRWQVVFVWHGFSEWGLGRQSLRCEVSGCRGQRQMAVAGKQTKHVLVGSRCAVTFWSGCGESGCEGWMQEHGKLQNTGHKAGMMSEARAIRVSGRQLGLGMRCNRPRANQ